MRAVMASNSNVGGNVIAENGSRSIVRARSDRKSRRYPQHRGQFAQRHGCFREDLGTVKIGDPFRTAALVKNSSEAVGGVIVARTGENTKEVIDRVKEKIKEIEPGLPPGVHIVPFYDRSQLIEATVGTLRHALLEEIILVTLAHVIFLMHFRSILVVTLPLPLAVLCSFLLMHYAHVTSNVMSLAGIAIAIGVLVDAGIVVTENAFRHLEGVDTNDRGRVFETVLPAPRSWLAVRPFSRWRSSFWRCAGVCAYWARRQTLSSTWLLPRPLRWLAQPPLP
jgi:Cu(I)/Ag(I) efflux system membrane protein CusA/SilA